MISIKDYGAYIPRYRLGRKDIYSAMGWLNPATAGLTRGEKAVANYDEDSITMAVSAARQCRQLLSEVTSLNFATVTPSYLERQNSAIIAEALDLKPETAAQDITASTGAGIAALLSAAAALGQGHRSALAVAADCRQAKAGSPQDFLFGDGAAAFVLGPGEGIARLEGSYTLAEDFPDLRRAAGEDYVRAWEERWIREQGYSRIIPAVVSGLLKKCGLSAADITRVILPCPFEKLVPGLLKKCSFSPEQAAPSLMAEVGDTGCAHPLLQLAAVLDESHPGDKLLAVGYGGGGSALLLTVTAEAGEPRVDKWLQRSAPMAGYEQYAVFRNKLEAALGSRGEASAPYSLSLLWREKKVILGLYGSRCTACGTPQYPEQRVCVNPDCRAIDRMEPYRFADKQGRLFTFTGDHLAFSLNPPALYGIVDFLEGGRFWFDLTDCSLEELKVDMLVEMSFRLKDTNAGQGMHTYFWKAVPAVERGA